MNCKVCGAPMDDGRTVCPACGAENAAEPQEQIQADGARRAEPLQASEDAQRADAGQQAAAAGGPADAEGAPTGGGAAEAEAAAPQDGAAEADEISAQEPPAPGVKKKPGKGLLAALIVVAVAAVAALVIMLVRNGADPKTAPDASTSEEAGEDGDDPLNVAQVDESGAFVAHDYLVADADVTQEMADAVVAASGDLKLNNAMLSYYYWQQYYNVLSSYMGSMLDPSKSMAEQMYDDTHSWQDMLLRSALSMFRQQAAACNAAKAAGFQMDETYTSYLDSLRDGMDSEAKSSGFDGADAYLQSLYGPYAGADSYLEYANNTLLASAYLQSLYDAVDCTDDEISAYFDENADSYAASGVTKDDTLMVNVRHILIRPAADEGAQTDENGSAVLTDQNWADAEAKANEIYAAWKAGDATEDSFAELATENSADTGSASNGGLYEGVYPGEMETAFNDWCFDSGRKAGDTGIVKTSYGYHILYFSGFGDTSYWYAKAKSDYLSDRQTQIASDLVQDSAFTVDHAKVVLMESSLTEPADQTAETDQSTGTDQSAETEQGSETQQSPATEQTTGQN